MDFSTTKPTTEQPPGAERGPDVTAALEETWRGLGPGYTPRTHLLDAEGRARFVNRLIREASPYLRQHAHNPVDWHPWSDATLAAAAARDMPIFLSVGYATCHWCHVMEEESFDDEQVAALLNVHFMPVKLDREQRPDLDQIYITATQLQQGHAGWPNSVWLTPDGRPFHTGTYFPKPQFIAMLDAVATAWRERRGDVDRVADQLSSAVQRMGAGRSDAAQDPSLPPSVEAMLSAQLAQMYNAEEGGFSNSQQFPQESFLLWQLDHYRRSGDGAAFGIAAHSLSAMVAGGLHDHAGGGFHRYTVDPNWRTPHFEKMLYNQGQLARALIEGWEITGEAAWARAAERCFGYVLRDMRAPDGRFYAAEDADSLDAEGQREEGAFYAWTPEQALTVLGAEAEWAIVTLGLDQPPTIEAGAVAHLTPGAEVDTDRLDPVLETLRQAREARPRPIRDDKVIASWNGLMIRALAEGGEALGRADLVEAAAAAGNALWDLHWDGSRLARLAGEGFAEPGLVEDYAWTGLGFLALHDATGDLPWLQRAVSLAEAAVALFADDTGRFRMAAEDGPLGPIYESQDGATPAGESSLAELFARLSYRLPAPDPVLTHAARARGVVSALAGALVQMPLVRPDVVAAARLVEAGESGYRRSVASGAVRLRLTREPDQPGRWQLTLRIAEAWHIALVSAGEGEAAVSGIRIEGAEAALPPGRPLSPAFAGGETFDVWDGTVVIDLVPEEGASEIALSLQVCADGLCLAPETTRFRMG